jgi:hypothetical protein
LDENDIQLGRVVCVSGSHVVMLWEQHGIAKIDPALSRLQKGTLVKLRTPNSLVFGLVTSLTIPSPTGSLSPDEAWLAELELIGESSTDDVSFRHGVSSFPTLGDPVWSTNRHDLNVIYARSGKSTVTLGRLYNDREEPISLETDLLLGRHFAILGATGCGKSCALTLTLQKLLEKHESAHIVLLDPHGEYHSAFADQAELLGPDRLRLPYWILNSDEIDVFIFGTNTSIQDRPAIAGILHDLIADAKNIYQGERLETRPITVNTPLPYRLSDINRLIDEAMGSLDKPASLAPYRWLKNRLEALSSDPRFAFMFGGITVHDTFADILSQILRIPSNGQPISIIDLSAVPSEVINAVVSVIMRLIFDFAHWSRGTQPGDGGAKLGHWSGGTVSPHRRCKTLPVVRLGPFDLGGALPGDVFCGGLQRGSSFRIH